MMSHIWMVRTNEDQENIKANGLPGDLLDHRIYTEHQDSRQQPDFTAVFMYRCARDHTVRMLLRLPEVSRDLKNHYRYPDRLLSRCTGLCAHRCGWRQAVCLRNCDYIFDTLRDCIFYFAE